MSTRPPLPSSSRTPLGRDRDFRLFWAGQTISAFGDAFAFVAMPLLVLEVTGSVQQMGLVTATAGVAQVATGMVSGIVMDRVHRRRLMIACDLLRLALYLTVPVAWWLGHRSLRLVYVVSALGAAFGNLFWVGYVAAIPNVVELDELGRANGALQAKEGTVKAQMKAKLATDEGNRVYSRRKVIVEPVFGQIKNRGFRHFLLRGIDKVRGEWALIAMCHNLLKRHGARMAA
jgi:Transposase DDE domain/Major Facilitator Superfamily